jgi:hypothetical protein
MVEWQSQCAMPRGRSDPDDWRQVGIPFTQLPLRPVARAAPHGAPHHKIWWSAESRGYRLGRKRKLAHPAVAVAEWSAAIDELAGTVTAISQTRSRETCGNRPMPG